MRHRSYRVCNGRTLALIALVVLVARTQRVFASPTDERRFWTPTVVAVDDGVGSKIRRMGNDVEKSKSFVFENTVAESLTRDGVVAVRVRGLNEAKTQSAKLFMDCARVTDNVAVEEYDDGSRRVTLATTTKQRGSGFGEPTSKACKKFEVTTKMLRAKVSVAEQAITDVFQSKFSDLSEFANGVLMQGENGETYKTFSEVLKDCEHLEHFHGYTISPQQKLKNSKVRTIEEHTDQGLLIAFVPAIIVDAVTGRRDKFSSTGDFYMTLPGHRKVLLNFDTLPDDVVIFMLGQAIEQQITPKLANGLELHAVPHAMDMPNLKSNQFRFWYGRMFLPPENALDESHGLSFGTVRANIIEDFARGLKTSVGCGRKLLSVAGSGSCASNQIWCWMRCMNHSAPASNPLTCRTGHSVQCLSQRLEVWTDADSHGDYNPGCTDETNETKPVTDPPTIPARAASCTDGNAWETFLNHSEYENSLELLQDKLYLLWTVQNGKLKARVAFNGKIGWFALGIKNLGGKHNGMNGANIVMGVHDPHPMGHDSNFGSPYVGKSSAKQYKIHDHSSAFRHWNDTADVASPFVSSTTFNSCFSCMRFETASIRGEALNLTSGINELIWAAHDGTYLKGYHEVQGFDRRDARGHLTLDLTRNYGRVTCGFSRGWAAASQTCAFSAASTPSAIVSISIAVIAILVM